MGNDDGLLHLVKIIFNKKAIDIEELKAKDPSIPSCFLTKEFSLCLEDVLRTKQILLAFRLCSFFKSFCSRMMSSHKKYCEHVLHACFVEHHLNKNIFESFLSVCALVRNMSQEVFLKTNVDFSDINPIILTVFYRSQLKTTLCRRGGLWRLVEYTLNHRYHKWKCQGKDNALPADPIANSNICLDDNFSKNLMKELNNEVEFRMSNAEHIKLRQLSNSLAEEIIRAVTFQLPTLPSYSEVVDRMEAYEKYYTNKLKQTNFIDKLENKLKDVSFPGCSGYKTSKLEQNESMSNPENIVQAVIRYNRFKSSTNKTNNIIQESDRVLEHLTNTIRSLIKILDEQDQK